MTFLAESGNDDEIAQVIAVSLLAGSIGWFIGACVGWFISRLDLEPSTASAWALRIAALLPVWLLSLNLRSLNGRPESIMLGVGAALVAGTLFVLAHRGRSRQNVAAVGAALGMVIIVAAWIALTFPLTI